MEVLTKFKPFVSDIIDEVNTIRNGNNPIEFKDIDAYKDKEIKKMPHLEYTYLDISPRLLFSNEYNAMSYIKNQLIEWINKRCSKDDYIYVYYNNFEMKTEFIREKHVALNIDVEYFRITFKLYSNTIKL